MRRNCSVLKFFLLLFLLIFCSFSFYAKEINYCNKIHFIDVGQGDASLIQTCNNTNILIDAGPQESSKKLLKYLIDNQVSKIDLFITTHPHEDHIGGAPAVLENFDVKIIIDSGIPHTTYTYRKFLETIDRKNIKYIVGREGINFKIDDTVFSIISPPHSLIFDDLNNNSICVKLIIKDITFLFMADAEKEAEIEILKKNIPIKSNVLKVGHHGSKSSTTSKFLNKVKPEIAIISVGGNNDYGHPHNITIKKLREANIKIYRTDIHGNILILTDGNGIKVKTER